jgi:peptidoglycan-associated lipoprotein
VHLLSSEERVSFTVHINQDHRGGCEDMGRMVSLKSLVIVVGALLLGLGCAQKSAQVSTPPPAAAGPSAEELRAREEAERRRRIAESQVATRSTTVTPGSSVMDTVYFEFDEATLTELSKDTLVRNAEWLRSNSQVQVQVEGHCDERGTAEYNLALGERRAEVVKSYLSSLGIASTRLAPISYGKERPAETGNGEAAWSRNRRVEFKAM